MFSLYIFFIKVRASNRFFTLRTGLHVRETSTLPSEEAFFSNPLSEFVRSLPESYDCPLTWTDADVQVRRLGNCFSSQPPTVNTHTLLQSCHDPTCHLKSEFSVCRFNLVLDQLGNVFLWNSQKKRYVLRKTSKVQGQESANYLRKLVKNIKFLTNN